MNTNNKTNTSKRSSDDVEDSSKPQPQDQVKKTRMNEVDLVPTNTNAASTKTVAAADAADSNSNSNSQMKKSKKDEIVDIAKAIGLKAGVRIEVRWDLSFDSDENAKADSSPSANKEQQQEAGPSTSSSTSETRWWGGTLLPADDRTYTIQNGNDEDAVTVPIRTIDYDPYLPSFPERSIEDVCFLTNRSLLNKSSVTRTCWRLEGDTWEPTADEDEALANGNENDVDVDDEISVVSTSQEDGLREVLDTILKSALQSSGVMAKMSSMDPSHQSIMAEKISNTKERLFEKLLEKLNNEEVENNKNNGSGSSNDNDNGNGNGVDRVITPELINIVMSELGRELRS